MINTKRYFLFIAMALRPLLVTLLATIFSAMLHDLAQAQVCAVPPSGMVSWWKAEGNANDLVGTNNGSLVGNAGYAAGKVGQAFIFDGNTGSGVQLGMCSNFQFQSFTVEAWVARSSTASLSATGPAVIFGFGSNGFNFFLSLGSAKPSLSKTAVDIVSSTGAAITDTNWHHIAVTKSNTTVIFYVDGVASPSATYANTFNYTSAAAIGCEGDNGEYSFLGAIDEVAVYGRPLFGAEIQAIYNAGYAGKCTGSQPPAILVQPSPLSISTTPFTPLSFAVGVGGSPPMYLQWQQNGYGIPGATNWVYSVAGVQAGDAGIYTLFASNSAGTVLSSNITLKVKVVTVLTNGQALSSNAYTFNGPVTIQMKNAYTNGDIFYTTDGSVPSPFSTLYTGPFSVTNSVTIQTLGFNADFSQAGYSDPLSITILPTYSLSATTPGGGAVTLNPSGASFLSNTVVSLTATPSNGWIFLEWLGDAGGTTPTNSVRMTRNKSVQAIFGTVVSNSAVGGGSVNFNPPGGIYAYGATLQASAMPQSGKTFVIWGNAVSSTNNPLLYVVTNANTEISALFSSLSGGQYSLSVVPLGHGRVSISPQANEFAGGKAVSITATPDVGQSFTGWSGGASGNQNPLGVVMNQSMLIYANFSTNNSLLIHTAARLGEGMVVDINGEIGSHYRLDGSTNLTSWNPLLNLTNSVGTIHYIDSTATNLSQGYYRAVILP